ncbi:TRAM/LAG1/CLN8 domain [Trinorchestia longiramus]|nr:TRAM/LAG1/CLN8 domain [Trinorchestia longiramus]
MNSTPTSNWFWTDALWVPSGYTWRDFQARADLNFPKPEDLIIYPFIITGYLLLLKYFILVPYLFRPLALYSIAKPKALNQNPESLTLTRISETHGCYPPWKVIVQAATTLGWTERQVQRWLRKNTRSKVNNTITKFVECGWQMTFYLTCCTLELIVLLDKPWFYDLKKCWSQFPFHSVTPGMWWCYMLSIGFYWSEIITHSSQPKRSDSLQNFIHHVCAVTILSCAWISNVSRLGLINLLVLQCNDIPLQLAKLSGYVGWQKTMDFCFFVFVAVWCATRLVIYPFVIMRAAFSETFSQADSILHVYHIIRVLMVALFIMNLTWTYSIAQVIKNKLKTGASKDVRSSDEEDRSEEEEKNISVQNAREEPARTKTE